MLPKYICLVRGVRMHRLYLSVVNWVNISFRKAGTTGGRKKRRKPYFMPNTIVVAREPIRKPAQLSRQLKNLKGYEMETVLAGEDGWNPVKNGNRMVEVKR